MRFDNDNLATIYINSKNKKDCVCGYKNIDVFKLPGL